MDIYLDLEMICACMAWMLDAGHIDTYIWQSFIQLLFNEQISYHSIERIDGGHGWYTCQDE